MSKISYIGVLVALVAFLSGCGPDGPPSEEEPYVGDVFFVSAAIGDDETAKGSRTAPFATIQAAIEAAPAASAAEIRVDEGVYEEPVVINTDLEIVGGFDSANGWAPSSQVETLIRWRGVVVSIANANAVRLASLRIEGFPSSTEAASVGIYATGSGSVQLEDLEIVAAAGASGADAIAHAGQAATGGPGADGYPGTVTTVGNANPGGAGGAPGCGCGGGGPGGAAGATQGLGVTGEDWDGLVCHAGAPSLSTPSLAPGGDGSAAGVAGDVGDFLLVGYRPRDGFAGDKGASGNGGMGGHGGSPTGLPCEMDGPFTVLYNSGGGGGGGGGCGGEGGLGGEGGAASVGLVALNTSVHLERVTITAADGGSGGAGAAGQLGGVGGDGGLGGGGASGIVACTGPWISLDQNDGQPGGTGGTGGAGGGGGGGPSLGIVEGFGGEVTEGDDVFVSVGAGGEGGQGPGSAGQVGLSLRRFQF